MPGKRAQKKRELFFSGNNPKTLHRNLAFTATEQYKLLRTNLSFTLPEDVKCPIIGVTSSMRGEGKSTTAINLSFVLAESGKKVLLVDGDLRIPSIARKMGADNAIGLTTLLKSREAIPLNSLKSHIFDNWYILPAGELPPNPSELLGSSRMEKLLNALAENFDYIVIDLPPVNIVADPLAISKYLSGLLVVVREDYTEKKELQNCLRQLELSGSNVLGIVLNETDSSRSYYRRYRYRSYYKHYSSYYSEKKENSEDGKTSG